MITENSGIQGSTGIIISMRAIRGYSRIRFTLLYLRYIIICLKNSEIFERIFRVFILFRMELEYDNDNKIIVVVK